MTVTPAGWQLDQLALLGAATMFLGAMLAVGLGFAVGRLRGAETGIGSGMLLWGLGNLAVSVLALAFVHLDTRVLALPLSRCEPGAVVQEQPQRTMFYALPVASGAASGAARREVGPFPAVGPCPEEQLSPEPLRVRSDDLASARSLIPGDAVDDRATVIPVIWGLFGGVGLLIGLGMLAYGRSRSAPAHQGRNARAQPVSARKVGPLPAWRKQAGEVLGILGLLSFGAAFVVSPFLDGSEERSIEFGLRSIASAMACWLVAGMLARTMTWASGLFLAAFGGVMLLLAVVVRHAG